MILLSARIVCAAALALAAAACTTTGGSGGGLREGSHATVAFDRIDGLPPPLFDRYVRKLGDEAEAKNVPVVTREGFAPYRVKGYAAVWTKGRKATLSWVWEIFDAQGERVMRIAGDETAGRAGKDAWQSVNDEVLARAARNGMAQLAVYFRGPESQAPGASSAPGQPEPVLNPPPSGPVVAGRQIASAASLR